MAFEFRDDDSGFIAWRDRNPGGFIINAERNSRCSYLKLHRADCPFMTKPTRSDQRRWTDQYIKICSLRRAELVNWARSLGCDSDPCPTCKP